MNHDTPLLAMRPSTVSLLIIAFHALVYIAGLALAIPHHP